MNAVNKKKNRPPNTIGMRMVSSIAYTPFAKKVTIF
jgi:hypothetical protein